MATEREQKTPVMSEYAQAFIRNMSHPDVEAIFRMILKEEGIPIAEAGTVNAVTTSGFITEMIDSRPTLGTITGGACTCFPNAIVRTDLSDDRASIHARVRRGLADDGRELDDEIIDVVESVEIDWSDVDPATGLYEPAVRWGDPHPVLDILLRWRAGCEGARRIRENAHAKFVQQERAILRSEAVADDATQQEVTERARPRARL